MLDSELRRQVSLALSEGLPLIDFGLITQHAGVCFLIWKVEIIFTPSLRVVGGPGEITILAQKILAPASACIRQSRRSYAAVTNIPPCSVAYHHRSFFSALTKFAVGPGLISGWLFPHMIQKIIFWFHHIIKNPLCDRDRD